MQLYEKIPVNQLYRATLALIIIPHHSPEFVITTYNSIDGQILTQSVYLASKHEYESMNLPMHNNINAHVLVAYDSMWNRMPYEIRKISRISRFKEGL